MCFCVCVCICVCFYYCLSGCWCYSLDYENTGVSFAMHVFISFPNPAQVCFS